MPCKAEAGHPTIPAEALAACPDEPSGAEELPHPHPAPDSEAEETHTPRRECCGSSRGMTVEEKAGTHSGWGPGRQNLEVGRAGYLGC